VAALLVVAATQGFLLGLSTGLFCLATCAPAFVPFIMAEERSLPQGAITLGELALGRLLAYLLFGLAVGYAGAKLNGPWLDKAVGMAMISLSVVMLLFVAFRKMPYLGLCRLSDKYSRFPVLFGFFTGINVCPPFLLAISSAAGMGSLWGSVLLFGGFFMGTTIYLGLLMPIGFLGAYEPVRITGLITIVLSSIFFLGLGITYLI
jgi:sulfite exporter TauE/SafE